ncbi:MAG: hypothetical protein HQK83_17220, partial [Fibrobacteria bacterium]|nr:hypothetical protein [Fibrobacteria bacterium]
MKKVWIGSIVCFLWSGIASAKNTSVCVNIDERFSTASSEAPEVKIPVEQSTLDKTTGIKNQAKAVQPSPQEV